MSKAQCIRMTMAAFGFERGDVLMVDEVIPVGDFLCAPVQYRVGEKYIHQRYVERLPRWATFRTSDG